MPMIDLRVVVFPAPLRPSRVTTSPAATWRRTPCKTCDSPYQARRSRTASSGARVAPASLTATPIARPSGIARTHVGLNHVPVARHGGVIALRDDLAPRQNRDGMRKVLDHAEIVLDHQHRAVGRD